MKYFIKLSSGKVTSVDKSTSAWASSYKWTSTQDGYPIRTKRKQERGEGPARSLLHREIFIRDGVNIKGLEVDHIDGDPLNNLRSNLRLCTRQQNARNIRKSKVNKSGFKGVSFAASPKARPWHARISVNGIKTHIGYFATKESAAQAYDEASKKYHGDFGSHNKSRPA